MENIDFLAYIRPELLIVLAVVYVVGATLKKTTEFKDKYIPFVLGCLSVIVCLFYFLGSAPYLNATIIFGVFSEALIQGLMIAACAVYGNQIVKQFNKKE